MKIADYAWTGLRWLYGLFFLVTGVAILLTLAGYVREITQPTAPAQAFYSALHASGIIDAPIAASYIVGGAALLLRRTTPLGLILLAPSVVVIFLFDWLLAQLPIPAFVTAGVWALLALRHLDGFKGLWSYGVRSGA